MDSQPTYEVSDIELERQAYRKHERRRSVATSIVSSIAFIVLVVLTLQNSPGWPRVKESFFSPEYFALAWPQVIDGLWLNVRVLIVAVLGTAVLGTTLALVRITTSAVMFPSVWRRVSIPLSCAASPCW